ncbi:cryptochrome/photolyase family protein [Streptomyces sp. IBSBF 2435]|uniref:cryptochrome/photolyase family protein n=1 Tax=Streptomyces sp. IBSBF 2435 TaxID=2903531 RepID=UPI002FDC13B3
MAPRTHWLLGDQFGRHLLDPQHAGPDRDAPVVMIEARPVLCRWRSHPAKAHLVLSAMRHRSAALGDRVRYVRAETYTEGVGEALGRGKDRLLVSRPTSRAALGPVAFLERVDVPPPKGFLVSHAESERWVDGRGGGLPGAASLPGARIGRERIGPRAGCFALRTGRGPLDRSPEPL